MANDSVPAKHHADWLAFIRRLQAQFAELEELVPRVVAQITVRALDRRASELTITPEDTVRSVEADAFGRREARYQRAMSSLLAGRR